MIGPARVLDRDEWARVEDPETLKAIEQFGLTPENTTIIGVEVDGRMVASAVLFDVSYLEGTFVAPDYRRHPRVVVALWRGIKAAVMAKGRRKLTTIAVDPPTRQLCESAGGRPLPGVQYSITVDGE